MSVHATLTPAERCVLEGIIEGKTSKQIALAHGRSSRTIDDHVANLKKKAGTETRAQLAVWASEHPSWRLVPPAA